MSGFGRTTGVRAFGECTYDTDLRVTIGVRNETPVAMIIPEPSLFYLGTAVGLTSKSVVYTDYLNGITGREGHIRFDFLEICSRGLIVRFGI
jgi:hypothetical protein